MRLRTKTASTLVALWLATAPVWAKRNIAKLAYQCTRQGKQSACQELDKIALEDKDSLVRGDAVEVITNQGVLAKVALEDQNSVIRISAIKNLTDQALLAKVVLGNEDASVSGAAVTKVTDQAALAKIAVEASAPQVRVNAVGKLTDEVLLTKIALDDRSSDIRVSAVSKLTGQSSLVKVALEAPDKKVRGIAIWQLTDQAALAKIAMEDKDASIRGFAVWKLSDQTALAKIAVEDKDVSIRTTAVGKITDEVLLAKVAVQDKDASVRATAVGRLTGHALLAKIAVEEKDESVRKAAVKREAELDKQAFPLGREFNFKSAAPFAGSAMSMFNKLEGGMDGDQYNEQIHRLAEDLNKIIPAPGAEKLLRFANTIVNQYRVASNIGSGITHVQIHVNGSSIRTELAFAGPVQFRTDPGSGMLQSTVGDNQESLQNACVNTQRMLAIFFRALSIQPDDVQRAVKEEIGYDTLKRFGLPLSSEQPGRLDSVWGDVTPPVPTYQPEPHYTPEALHRKVEGVVGLRFVVDTNGNVGDVMVIKSLEPGLDDSAVRTVRMRKFQPATRNGVPVAFQVVIETRFKLF